MPRNELEQVDRASTLPTFYFARPCRRLRYPTSKLLTGKLVVSN
jgi:hypothetical protein